MLSSPPSSMRTERDQDSPEVLQTGTRSARAKFKQLSQRRTRPPQDKLGHMGGMWRARGNNREDVKAGRQRPAGSAPSLHVPDTSHSMGKEKAPLLLPC